MDKGFAVRLPKTAGVLLAAGMLGACSRPEPGPPCRPGLRIEPAPVDGRLHLLDNSVNSMTAHVELCDQAPADYTYEWRYDANGNGVIDEDEQKYPVSRIASWSLVACFSDRGDHLITVDALPADPTADPRAYPPLTTQFVGTVEAGATVIARPTCVAPSIAAVRSAGEINGGPELEPITAAVDCLDPYLEKAVCDFEATIASGLANFALFASRIPERFSRRHEMTEDDVSRILADEVEPILNRYLTLDAKAPADFSFVVDGVFKLKVFDDLPYLDGDETVYVLMQGEHDMGDIRSIAALAHGLRAAIEGLLAYEGTAQFLLDTPELDQVNLPWLERSLITKLEEDPKFLTLVDDASPDGRTRLLTARAEAIAAIEAAQRALEFVVRETDNQVDDLVRYWDCGSDGVCDCSDVHRIMFLDCPNDNTPYPGPDADGTENNGRYDRGEPVGLDRIALTEFFTLDLPSDVDEFVRQIGLVKENLRGPDALDLDEVVGFPVGPALELFAIPRPDIRLSEWFLTPAQPRELVPLYSRARRRFIFDSEGEPWDDVGYDGVADVAETIVDWPNPRNLTLGTAFDPVTNPDPHFDNLDPICNPVCGMTDHIDNDGDGLIDDDDRVRIDRFGFVVVVPQELGVESNLMFDFVDLNGNRAHDVGEPHEPFDDTGVRKFRGVVVGAANGRWDFADTQHAWPVGGDVAPRGDQQGRDPANGIANDEITRLSAINLFGEPSNGELQTIAYDGLFDPFYFFMPDPTMSRVLTFPEEIQSVDGEMLNENAKLHRFFNKLIELATLIKVGRRTGDGIDMAPANLGGHICASVDACLASQERWE